ncbi:MAG TPA: ATP synthase F1 subunit gamma [Papillibacter sp.]|nr:ATP synthase F1 subunit gamma [Papillibacter sp.]
MAHAAEIRQHIAAVEQTKKITGAMELVSSMRMRRVMSHIEHNHRYFEHVQKTMKQILAAHHITHPYLRRVPEGGHCTFIVISGDKGLCGAYNANVLNLALEKMEEKPNNALITIGRTAEAFFRARGREPDMCVLGLVQDPTLSRVRPLARDIMRLFDTGQTEEIQIVYTSFFGETKNMAITRRLLPVLDDDYAEIEPMEEIWEILYHPSEQEVFDLLVPQYVLGIVFGVLVQSYASEHYARMNAMHGATTNATEMLKSLKTQYNMARQAAITNEIAEITGAVEILKKGGHQYGQPI